MLNVITTMNLIELNRNFVVLRIIKLSFLRIAQLQYVA